MELRPRTAALGAGACLAVLALVWFAAFHVGFAERADQTIYLQFLDLQAHSRINGIAAHAVSPFNPDPYVYLVLVPLGVSLLRRRPWSAVAVLGIVLGANVTTELLKHVLTDARPTSWPSGHSTAAMSLALASVLAAPPRLRPTVAALGALLAVAAGWSVIVRGMHYPSDVVGGFLVAGMWALLAVSALRASERWRPWARAGARPMSLRATLGAPSAILAAAMLLAGIVVVSRLHRAFAYARGHEAFVVAAVGIAALGVALSAALMLSVRR
ncbi:MAG: phosphatase PAP2 family protein [Solirubrobacterales bacterium]|nr:phosphatase PAP2 family protein [Solirubrobacterales bacterium]